MLVAMALASRYRMHVLVCVSACVCACVCVYVYALMQACPYGSFPVRTYGLGKTNQVRKAAAVARKKPQD